MPPAPKDGGSQRMGEPGTAGWEGGGGGGGGRAGERREGGAGRGGRGAGGAGGETWAEDQKAERGATGRRLEGGGRVRRMEAVRARGCVRGGGTSVPEGRGRISQWEDGGPQGRDSRGYSRRSGDVHRGVGGVGGSHLRPGPHTQRGLVARVAGGRRRALREALPGVQEAGGSRARRDRERGP